MLVLGTFSGPKTPFFKDLRPALSSLFPKATIDTIAWSGGNDLESRYRAESALLRKIRTFKSERVLIVAHSHGGNFAYRAVARYKPKNGVTIAGVCTIGTPFIELVVRTKAEERVAFVAKVVSFLVELPLFFVFVAPLGLAIIFGVIVTTRFVGIPPPIDYFVLVLIILGLMFAGSALPIKVPSLADAINSKLDLVVLRWRESCLRRARPMLKSLPIDVPHLCVMGGEDDAFGWLSFIRAATALPQVTFVFFFFLLRYGLWFGLGLYILGSATNVVETWLLTISRGRFTRPGIADDMQHWCFRILLLLALAFVLSALVSFVLGPWLMQTCIGFGARRFGLYLWIKPVVLQLPPESRNMTSKTILGKAAGLLLHTSYLRDENLMKEVCV